jgi:hypothetical protein
MFKFIHLIILSLGICVPAFAENPIIIRYRDPKLPSFIFNTLPSDARYTDPAFVPTNLTSIDDAKKLMEELRFNSRSKAECFQRAHLWALEMRQMMNAQTQKVFLFFSDKYTRRTGFDWWFHVAPFILVNGVEMVLDPFFFDHPVDMKTWTDRFMDGDPECLVANTYQEYENQNTKVDCILRKVPMYYYAPSSVEARDKSNQVISDWIDDEVIGAHRSLVPWWKF